MLICYLFRLNPFKVKKSNKLFSFQLYYKMLVPKQQDDVYTVITHQFNKFNATLQQFVPHTSLQRQNQQKKPPCLLSRFLCALSNICATELIPTRTVLCEVINVFMLLKILYFYSFELTRNSDAIPLDNGSLIND